MAKSIDKTAELITSDLQGWDKFEGKPTMSIWIEDISPNESMITAATQQPRAPSAPVMQAGNSCI